MSVEAAAGAETEEEDAAPASALDWGCAWEAEVEVEVEAGPFVGVRVRDAGEKVTSVGIETGSWRMVVSH